MIHPRLHWHQKFSSINSPGEAVNEFPPLSHHCASALRQSPDLHSMSNSPQQQQIKWVRKFPICSHMWQLAVSREPQSKKFHRQWQFTTESLTSTGNRAQLLSVVYSSRWQSLPNRCDLSNGADERREPRPTDFRLHLLVARHRSLYLPLPPSPVSCFPTPPRSNVVCSAENRN